MRSIETLLGEIAYRCGFQISRTRSAQGRLPIEATPRERAIIREVLPYTMTSAERIWSLLRAVRYVIEEAIPGDLVECGVWRGGSIMAMVRQLESQGIQDRRIWLYDTFSGMTAPRDIDVEVSTGTTAQILLSKTPRGDGDNVWSWAQRTAVEQNLGQLAYPSSNYVFVEGDVVATLASSVPEQIALLRLDTDWYESTAKELAVLYPRLVVGGVCILDDFGHWAGARQAVEEYFEGLGTQPLMFPIDYSGRIFVKPESHGDL